MTDARKVNFADAYARIRGGAAFLVFLISFCVCWLAFHYTHGWDADFGTYNMILSTEASVSLAAFAAIGEKQYKATIELLTEIRELAKTIRDKEDKILKEVEHDQL